MEFEVNLSTLDARTVEMLVLEDHALPAAGLRDLAAIVSSELLQLEAAFRDMHGVGEITALRGFRAERGDLYKVALVPFGSPDQLCFALERRAGTALLTHEADILLAAGKLEADIARELRAEAPELTPEELQTAAAERVRAKAEQDRQALERDAWIDSSDFRYAVHFANTGSSARRPEHAMIIATPGMHVVLQLDDARLWSYGSLQPVELTPNAFIAGLLRAAAQDLIEWGNAVI